MASTPVAEKPCSRNSSRPTRISASRFVNHSAMQREDGGPIIWTNTDRSVKRTDQLARKRFSAVVGGGEACNNWGTLLRIRLAEPASNQRPAPCLSGMQH